MPTLSAVVTAIKDRIEASTTLTLCPHVDSIRETPDAIVPDSFSVWPESSERVVDASGRGCLHVEDSIRIEIADRVQTGSQLSTVQSAIVVGEGVRDALTARAWQRTAAITACELVRETRTREGGWVYTVQDYTVLRLAE